MWLSDDGPAVHKVGQEQPQSADPDKSNRDGGSFLKERGKERARGEGQVRRCDLERNHDS